MNASALIFGTLAATLFILAAYEAAKPAIADSAGAYVTAHALDNVPPDIQPLVDALGADAYSRLLGDAVAYALKANLP